MSDQEIDPISNRAELQRLLSEGQSSAKSVIIQLGAFRPFAIGLSADSRTSLISLDPDMAVETSETDALQALRLEVRALAEMHAFIAVGIFYNSNLVSNAGQEPSDAISAELDHSGSDSIIVHIPYSVVAGRVEFGDAIASLGRFQVFERSTN